MASRSFVQLASFTSLAGAAFILVFSSISFAQENPLAPKKNPLVKKNPLTREDPFTGSYEGDGGMSLTLETAGEAYRGELRFEGNVFPVKAKRTENGVAGTFRAGDEDYEFEATIEDGKMRLESAGSEYSLSKRGASGDREKDGEAPLGGGPGGTKPARANPLFERGKVFKHHLGFTFRYPEDWSVREEASVGGLMLTPPGHKAGPQGPEELYVITGQPAPGITKVDDPQVVSFLDASVAQILPVLRRSAEPKAIASGSGPGMLLVYEGKNPEGKDLRARLSVCLIEGFGVTFTAVGLAEHIDARKGAVQEMFETFGYSEAEKDEKLLGAWFSETFQSVKSPDSGLDLTTKMTMILRKDGTFARVARTLGIADTKSGDYAVDTGGKKAAVDGRWSTRAGHVYLIWNDGTYSDYEYYVQGAPGSREMLFKWGRDKKELWTEIR